MKKRWIHAARRDVGRFFASPGHQKCVRYISSLVTKGLDGRMSLKTRAVLSIFAW